MIDFKKIPLGMHDEVKDKRNYNLQTVGVMIDGDYPKVVSPIIKHPIRNQGYTSMCFAFSEAKMIETQHYLETGETIKVSEGFIYWLKTMHSVEGMAPIFDLENIRKIGAVQAKDFEAFGSWYEIDAKLQASFNENDLKLKAQFLRAKTTLQLSAEELPAYLHLWHGGIISVNVYDSFYETTSNGMIPPISGALLGGHAMYVDQTEYIDGVLCASGDNSWGEDWGDNGRFHIPLNHPCINTFYGSVDVTPITNTITLTIGSKTMVSLKGNIELPVAPQLVNGTTMIPLRAVSEMFGKLVEWKPLVPSKPNQEGSQIVVKMPLEIEKLLVI